MSGLVIKAGRTYQVTHSEKGIYDVKIIHLGKTGIYVEIENVVEIWTGKESSKLKDIGVGDNVRLTRGLIKFKK